MRKFFKPAFDEKHYVMSSVIIMFFCIFTLIFSSCSDNSGNNPPRNKLSKLKERESIQFGEISNVKQVTPKGVDIVVDVSGSMKGFASTDSLQDLMQNTISTIGPELTVHYYKLDKDITSLQNYIDLFSPSLFNGSEADFNKAFSLLKYNSNYILIIITDFQFNDTKKYMNLIRTFQTEIISGYYIKIFSAKPYFDGLIFPQMTNKLRYTYKGPRPLYAIVIGRQEHSRFIEQILRKSRNWTNSITLSNNTPDEWRIYYSNAKIIGRNKNYLYMSSQDSLVFKLQDISSAIYDWGKWTSDEVIPVSYFFKDSTYIASNEDFKVRSVSSKSDTCSIVIESKKVNPTKETLLKIYLRPNKVPIWVDEQSCNENGDQAKNTLLFKNFIENVIKPVTNPFTVGTINIYITNN